MKLGSMIHVCPARSFLCMQTGLKEVGLVLQAGSDQDEPAGPGSNAGVARISTGSLGRSSKRARVARNISAQQDDAVGMGGTGL